MGRGVPVTLLERDGVAVNRASLRNEGKIHLGLIYANDPSHGTALLQLDGALRFRGIVGRWLGDDAGWLSTSTPFHYLVARDSLLAPDALAAHYRAVEAGCRERLVEKQRTSCEEPATNERPPAVGEPSTEGRPPNNRQRWP